MLNLFSFSLRVIEKKSRYLHIKKINFNSNGLFKFYNYDKSRYRK